jgi:hypothetical protein
MLRFACGCRYSFGVDIGSLFHQQTDHVQPASLACQIQWCLTKRKKEKNSFSANLSELGHDATLAEKLRATDGNEAREGWEHVRAEGSYNRWWQVEFPGGEVVVGEENGRSQCGCGWCGRGQSAYLLRGCSNTRIDKRTQEQIQMHEWWLVVGFVVALLRLASREAAERKSGHRCRLCALEVAGRPAYHLLLRREGATSPW